MYASLLRRSRTKASIASKELRQRTHQIDRAVEHHLDRIFGQRVFERHRLGNVRVVPRPVLLPSRMLPVHGLEDHLTIGVAIEDEGRGVAIVAHRVQHPPRDVAVEQPTRERRAVHTSLDRAVADDHRNRRGQREGNRPREWIAAPGHQCDMDTSGHRSMNGIAVLIGQSSLAVEQRAVEIEQHQLRENGRHHLRAQAR